MPLFTLKCRKAYYDEEEIHHLTLEEAAKWIEENAAAYDGDFDNLTLEPMVEPVSVYTLMEQYRGGKPLSPDVEV